MCLEKNKVAIGVVLYNPSDIGRLSRCLYSLEKQTDKIYIWDNSTQEVKLQIENSIIYKSANGNCGMAYALNRIMELACADGYEWVITMDQDSILPEGIIKDYSKHFNDDNVGIICPQVRDRRRPYMMVLEDNSEDFVDMCITSASCTSVGAWKRTGGFDEWLFIDLVDNEFCMRLRLSGYKILRLNKWVLDQEFGKVVAKPIWKQKFWLKLSRMLHNDNIAKLSYKKTVDPMRVYYTNRNIIYINKKLKKYGTVGYDNYNCKGYLGFIISFILPSVMRSQNKLSVIKEIFNGIRDGIKSRPKVWSATDEW